MKPLIGRVDITLIKKDLAKLKPIRQTRRGGNLVYVFRAIQVPNLFKEVARLREVTYRFRGGGTGKSLDEDDYDWRKNPYHQVIIWSESETDIIGGFRYGLGKEGHFATQDWYVFSEDFLSNYFPFTLDIGRMFIQPKYQSLNSMDGIFSLDNIWDGLGAVLSKHLDIKFLLGRIVSFRSETAMEQMIADFFIKSFTLDEEKKFIFPQKNLFFKVTNETLFKTGEAKYNYKMLIKQANKKGVLITPLIFAYMNVAKTLNYMGTVLDVDLNVLESCIFVRVVDIYPHFKRRHFLIEKNQKIT